jgi:hypothetical protein
MTNEPIVSGWGDERERDISGGGRDKSVLNGVPNKVFR